MATIGRKPREGFGYNPLKKLPRNGPCVCGSGKKYKKCCLEKMPDILPNKVLENLKRKDAPMKSYNVMDEHGNLVAVVPADSAEEAVAKAKGAGRTEAATAEEKAEHVGRAAT